MNYPDRVPELGRWVKSLIIATMIIIVALAILELFGWTKGPTDYIGWIPRAQSAPAPPPKNTGIVKNQRLYGIWTWKNGDWMSLQSNGDYYCYWLGKHYKGSWAYSPGVELVTTKEHELTHPFSDVTTGPEYIIHYRCRVLRGKLSMWNANIDSTCDRPELVLQKGYNHE